MYHTCPAIVYSPNIIIDSVGISSLEYMFYSCTSLLNANVKINVTEIPNRTFYATFHTCTSLYNVSFDMTKVTKTNLQSFAYLFNSCTSLTTIPKYNVIDTRKIFLSKNVYGLYKS